MFELNSIKTTCFFFHLLEKDKPIVVVKNYLLLSKIGCQTKVAITTVKRHRNYQRARARARERRAKVRNINFFSGALTLSTCSTPNLPHFPNGSVPTFSLESKAFPYAFWFVGTANGRVVFRILQKQTEIGLDSSEICGFLLQGLFVHFCLFFLRLILRSFTWATNNITK